jgi:hypothetical protein
VESNVRGFCRPVFSYFIHRQVVDNVKKAMQDKNANLRVFGNTSSSENRRRQGEIYVQKANGDQPRQMLNLAMKCFVSVFGVGKCNLPFILLALACV